MHFLSLSSCGVSYNYNRNKFPSAHLLSGVYGGAVDWGNALQGRGFNSRFIRVLELRRQCRFLYSTLRGHMQKLFVKWISDFQKCISSS